MFYSNEHYMSISHIALIVNMVHDVGSLCRNENRNCEFQDRQKIGTGLRVKGQ